MLLDRLNWWQSREHFISLSSLSFSWNQSKHFPLKFWRGRRNQAGGVALEPPPRFKFNNPNLAIPT